MAEETNEGASYLKALKQSIAGPPIAPGAAPQHDPQADISLRTGGEEHYEGAEKRRSPRYKCEGSVEIREEGTDVHTWATFTDVGLHGCYIEAQATYPVGTVLYLKLEACDHSVDVKAEVRVNYPYLGMGIVFLQMSHEDREQLRELLSAISRPRIAAGDHIEPPPPLQEQPPMITDSAASMRALISFFESRQLLMREDFWKIVKKTQK